MIVTIVLVEMPLAIAFSIVLYNVSNKDHSDIVVEEWKHAFNFIYGVLQVVLAYLFGFQMNYSLKYMEFARSQNPSRMNT
jgi:formate hydrogenlyase subunit 4